MLIVRLDHVSGVIQELVFILILERIINCYCSNSIIDTILHDSYFIIGHLHYVPSPGAIYTTSAAFYTY